jgi:hypothetical protein
MNHHRFRKLAPLAAYGDLTGREKSAFERHRSECPVCAAHHAELLRALRAMSRREAAADAGLSRRILSGVLAETGTRPGAVPAGKRRGVILRFLAVPRSAAMAAAAVVLVILGVVIGRLTVGDRVSRQTATGTVPEGGQPFTFEQATRVNNYLDRSRTLLIGILNEPAASGGGTVPDFQAQSSASRQLVREGRSLQDELSAPDAARARRLISELELIFLQIANLEQRMNLEGVAVVRAGSNQSGILLRINLEQMDLDDRAAKASSEHQKTQS